MYTWFKLYKYLFSWSTLISRNVYLFHGIKILILKKFVDIKKYIPVSRYENVNFDEVVVFPEMYTWFKLHKYLFSWSTLISRIVYLFQVRKISILKKYVEFQKWIPVPRDHNINFEEVAFLMKSLYFQKCIPDSSYTNIYFQEVRWFPELYTYFRLNKYLFWWSTLIFRNEYLFHGIKLLILKKYVDFQECIPVSGYKNINFDEVVVFPEMYT